MNELEFLDKFIKPLSNHPSSLNMSDDACVIDKLSTKQFVMSMDTILENVHFIAGTSPRSIAHKLLSVNLSDIAAMGAVPRYYLMSVVLSNKTDDEWVAEFTDELNKQNSKYHISIVGGDTVKHNGPMAFSLTMIGEVNKYKAVTRSGAQVGNDVYVTGNIGDAAIGLLIAKDSKHFAIPEQTKVGFVNKYVYPTPRVEIGSSVSNIATSMIDISDGFILDASRVAQNSNVSLDIDISKMPWSPEMIELMKDYDVTEVALTGGDDYELLFTISSEFEGSVNEIAKLTNTRITKIGKVIAGNGKVFIKDKNQNELAFSKAGYVHD